MALENNAALLSHDHSGVVGGTSRLSQLNTHQSPDTDSSTSALHHTIGLGATQAASGTHTHAAYAAYQGPINTLSTGVSARYYNPSVQSIPNATNYRISFPSSYITSTYITRNLVTSGHQFTLNVSGVYAITTTVRIGYPQQGEAYCAILLNSQVVAADGASMAGGVGGTRNISTVQQFLSNDIIEIQYFQSSGGTVNTDVGSPAGSWVNVSLTWLHA